MHTTTLFLSSAVNYRVNSDPQVQQRWGFESANKVKFKIHLPSVKP
jgi:hypothetical protein